MNEWQWEWKEGYYRWFLFGERVFFKKIVFNGFIWASQIRAYLVIAIPKRTQYWLDSFCVNIMSEYDHNTHLLWFLNGRQPQIEMHLTLITRGRQPLMEDIYMSLVEHG